MQIDVVVSAVFLIWTASTSLKYNTVDCYSVIKATKKQILNNKAAQNNPGISVWTNDHEVFFFSTHCNTGIKQKVSFLEMVTVRLDDRDTIIIFGLDRERDRAKGSLTKLKPADLKDPDLIFAPVRASDSIRGYVRFLEDSD